MTTFSAELLNFVTVVGIVLGIAGAAWKWFFAEWLRTSREMPSLEGDVSIVSAPRNANARVLQIDVVWKNTSSMPLHADCANVRAYLAPIGRITMEGAVRQLAIQEVATQSLRPLEGCPSFILEPNTTSRVQMVVNLDSKEPHLFAFHFPLSKLHKTNRDRIVFDRIALIG